MSQQWSKLPKRISARVAESDQSTNKQMKDSKLIGNTNEASIKINNFETTALLDSGSCVSLISESFFKQHLQNTELQPLKNILQIECADGQSLPYIGYVEVELQIDDGLPNSKPNSCLFLVTPDTSYSAKTPAIIGTNILNELLTECKDNFGEQFLQKAKLHTPWYLSFRCLVVREKELKRNKNRLAVIRNASAEKIIVHPNESIHIRGYTDKEIDYHPTSAMIQETEDSSLPSDIDITPGMVHYVYGNNKEVIINISNLTTNSVTIAPKAILCELQLVTIDEEVFNKIEDKDIYEDIIEDIQIDNSKQLTDEQNKKIRDLLYKHKELFSTSDTDIGNCEEIKHRIDLIDDLPFKQRHRRISPMMIDEIRKHLEQLLSAGIIRKSKSPWASNVVLVRKKSGKLRMCVDYRMLNNRSVKDSYALPRIQEVFDVLQGSKYFSTIDQKSGYHQVEIEENHKERTAFTVGPLGFYEYNKMPFGLSNSPATYQRLMEECLGDYNMKICVIYLDDLIIFSSTFEEHLQNLDKVLTRLKECNLKLSPEKCFFIQEKVHFLGHVVSKEGIETDPEKIDKIKNWPRPNNSDELRSYLAFCGYYRRFVKDFSKLTRPLSELLPPTSRKNSKKVTKEWHWTEVEEEVFNKLKDILSSPPILAFPDFKLPFELHTDASTKALGAILYQIQDGKKRVISYGSRALTKSEKNYSAFKLEFLALKWAVTEKFSDYLALKHFSVLTDNNPLTYVLTSAKLDATGQRWASALGEYDFDITYRAGINNADADGMSRYPYERLVKDEEDMIQVEDNVVKVICSSIVFPPYIETLPAASINIVEVTEDPGTPMAQIEMREIRRRQRQDNTIETWRRAVIDKTLPRKNWNRDDILMRRNFRNFRMRRGILYRHLEEENLDQLVIPECYRLEILTNLHDNVGHPGRERTLALLRERFYWPRMSIDVENHVLKCGRCLRRKTNVHSRAPLVNITTTYPLEMVCMDYLTLEPAKGISNVLVITDHFTKFAMAIPTKNQTAKTTAEAFYNNFIVHYGIPTSIHSDQGANFQSEIMRELCMITNMKKTRTTIYHAMGNGITERFNRTLLNMLGTLETSQKTDWKKHIPSLVYAYNSTPHESTKISPYELMFGRKAKLPIDAVFQQATDEITQTETSHTEYIEELRTRMEKTRQIVKDYTDKSRLKQKTYFDKKAKAATISVGDKVLVKILKFDGKHKIADKFEDELYDVTEQPREEIPVFKVKSEKTGRVKLLHRNHLFPVQYREAEDGIDMTSEIGEKKEQKERKDASKEKEKDIAKISEDMDESDDSDSDMEIGNGYVTHTYTNGDAHDPSKNHISKKKEEKEKKNVDNEEDTEVKVTDVNHTDLHEDDLEIIDNDTDVEETEEVAEIENITGDIPVVIEEEPKGTEMSAEDNEEESESEDEQEETEVKEVPIEFEESPRPPPKPIPRRTVRERKKPGWHDSYQMNQMVPRQYDSNLQAFDVLMNSGVLNRMDTQVAKKLLETLSEQKF